ncbi:MAG: putative adenylyl cyclase CyaB [Cryomorphaceae bacterium]|jgi:predicted adenylyl cyclase CyaB
MAKNIEIKARANNTPEQRAIASSLSDCDEQLIVQRDTFFNVEHGRLKLRVFADQSAELIFYRRRDSSGPTLSEYFISKTKDPAGLMTVLAQAYGVAVQVNKHRTLYLSGRTRIHFDQVEKLGDFIELEVVMAQDEALSDGEAEVQRLMQKLGITTEHLVDVAYADLITQQSQDSEAGNLE